jgi:hypothetical protein
MHITFLPEITGRRNHSKDHCTENNIKMYHTEIGGTVWTGFIWLRIGTVGVLL